MTDVCGTIAWAVGHFYPNYVLGSGTSGDGLFRRHPDALAVEAAAWLAEAQP